MQEFFLTIILLSLITSVLILILSASFSVLKTRISPKVQYWTWVLLFISLLIPFRPSFGRGLIHIPQETAVSTSTQTVQQASEVVQTAKPDLWTSFLNLPWLGIFLGIWALGVLFQLTKHALAYYKFKQMVGRWGSEIEDLNILEHFFEMKERLGIKEDMTLVHYPAGHSPMMTGFKKLKVLLPETNYTDEELDLIFEHELTHYLHRDIYVNLLGIIVTSLYWFNPIVRFGYKEIQEAGEIYCDYAVLKQRDSNYRTFYGETIITMIDQHQKQPVALTTCFYSNKFSLKRRITAIMNNVLPKRVLSIGLLILFPLSLLLSGSIFAFTSQQEPNNLASHQEGGISREQALEQALEAAGLSRQEAKEVTITPREADYDIRFRTESKGYHYHIARKDGSVLASNIVNRKGKQTTTSRTSQSQTTTTTVTETTTTSAPVTEPATEPVTEPTPEPAPAWGDDDADDSGGDDLDDGGDD